MSSLRVVNREAQPELGEGRCGTRQVKSGAVGSRRAR